MKYLAVKHWERHQHYGDSRTPPWIKLYNALLDDYEFLSLPEVAQAQLVKLWLLASRHKNRIPYDLVYISGKINPKSALDIDGFITSGFLTIEDDKEAPAARGKSRKPRKDKGKQRKQSASTPLAPRLHDASAYKEEEKEEEKEKEQEKSPGVAAGGWPAEAADILAERGSFAIGRVGKALAATVARYGWDVVRIGLKDFVIADRPKFGGGKHTPETFAAEDATWCTGTDEPYYYLGAPTARGLRTTAAAS